MAACLAWLGEHYDMERLLGTPELSTPTLDRMRALMGLLGDPQDAVPAVHVTGTNGKGSTVRTAVELFGAAGLVAGSYTSPHLDAVNDRISIANQSLSNDDFTSAISDVAAIEALATERHGTQPSYFEVLAAAAYNWFCDNAHVNVIEVGMGGRWDATNVVNSQVAVITNIGNEHLEIIGPTLADVAYEKAGIIKPESSVVCGETDPELVQVISQVAKDVGCEMWQAERDYQLVDRRVAVGGQVLDLVTPYGKHDDVFVPLHGAHQAQNMATALTAVETFFGRALGDEVIAEALHGLRVPGRFEFLSRSPAVVTDGAHNVDGATALSATMTEVFGPTEGDTALVIGVSRPHEPTEILSAVEAQRYTTVIATAFDWPRSLPTGETAKAALSLGIKPSYIHEAETVADAINQATDAVGPAGRVLVTGSLYVVSEARAHFGRGRS